MRYFDPTYGGMDIEEPVLLDLMQTQAMQRLRGVLQHGVTALIGITPPVTRFDHSLGVVLLVRRLGGSLEEQIKSISPATRFEWDDVDPTFRVSTKLRTIDPDVLIGDRFLPLSACDANFARHRTEYLRSHSGQWPMRVVP